MRTQSVILNLIPSGVNPVVHLSQYDQEDDGALLFNIYDGNVLADLTDCTATIEGTKPDGTFYMYPCTVYSTYLTSAVNFQMTSIAGSYPAEVRINRGAENVGTINLTMMVEPAGVGRVDVSDTEIPSLLDDIETSVDEAEYWAHVAEQAVTGVASWNGRTGAVVPVAGDYDASQVDYDNSNSGLTSNRSQGAIDELTPKKIITPNDAFNPAKTYTAGEWFIHQGVLYEVITACTGITPPNATYYNPITLHELKNRIDALNSELVESKIYRHLCDVTLTTTLTDVTVPSLSDVNEFLFIVRTGNYGTASVRGSVVIPSYIFKSKPQIYILGLGGTMATISVQYKNDTTVSVVTSESIYDTLKIWTK